MNAHEDNHGRSLAAWAQRRPWVCLCILLLLGLALRVLQLNARGLWTDEFHTLIAIRLPLRTLLTERMQMGHFPTYFLALKAWVTVAGDREAALRLPSALFATASAAFVFLFALRAWGGGAALWATVFYLLHERTFWAAHQARPYGLLLLAAAASFHALLRAWESRRMAWWLAYALWTALGLLSHVTFAFLFAGQLAVLALWSWRARQWRRDWMAWSGGLALFALMAYGGMHLMAAEHMDEQFEAAAVPSAGTLFDAILDISWGDVSLAPSALEYLVILTFGLSLWIGWRAWRRGRASSPSASSDLGRLALWLAAGWSLSILIGLTAFSAFVREMIYPRYWMASAGGAMLLLGWSVTAVGSARWRKAWTVLCVVCLAAVSIEYVLSPGDQLREAIRQVAQARRVDEPVIFTSQSYNQVMADYYGLGAVPVGISRKKKDRTELQQAIEQFVGQAPGFWMVLYREKDDSPLADVAQQWAQGRYSLIASHPWKRARVLGFRKTEPAAVSPGNK